MTHYDDGRVRVLHGDCLDVLPTLPAASVDAVVTDPPYGISFMGREWDRPGQAVRATTTAAEAAANPYGRARAELADYSGGTAAARAFGEWCEVWAAECLRVLKPGGHLLAFGGTRTFHRLAVAVEDAGFEIRDQVACLLWAYGSGFPKSLDVGKAIDRAAGAEREVIGMRPAGKGIAPGQGNYGGGGQQYAEAGPITAPATPEAARWEGWGTALKPAWEPVIVARKPLAGTVAANVLEHGTGALNIDGCRVAHASEADRRESEAKNRHGDFGTLHGGNQVYGDYSAGGVRDNYTAAAGRWPANLVLTHHPDCGDRCAPGCHVAELDQQSGESASPPVGSVARTSGGNTIGTFAHAGRPPSPNGHGDAGGASRFYPVFRYTAKAPGTERPRAGGVAHPTVKPVDLMRWLVRLVTPPGGLVLDPFAGSGTTGEACQAEGVRALLIEREADYLPLITQRLTKRTDPVQHLTSRGDDLGLFDLLDGEDQAR